jgi:hypothetical protein
MVWVGSLLTIGFGVVPVLFATLDRITAGAVAATLFRGEAFTGVLCGILSLALGNVLVRRGAFAYRRFRWLLVGMLLCVLIGYFAIEPFMDALRTAALNAGTDVMQSAHATRFALLHGVSSVFYLVESLLGIALVWLLPLGERKGEMDAAPSAPGGASADSAERVQGDRQ